MSKKRTAEQLVAKADTPKVWEVADRGVTSNYDVFRTLDGNRPVKDDRVVKIIGSILTIGYVPVPIVVNEHMEVVDGQGRLQARRLLGLPVHYMIIPGTGIDDCIQMNISSTSWSVEDFINTWAGTIDDYARFKSLMGRGYSMNVTYCAATGKQTIDNKRLKSGEFKLSTEEFIMASQIFDYLDKYEGCIKKHRIKNKANLYIALCFCWQLPDVDHEYLLAQMNKYGDRFTSSAPMDEVMKSLEEIYLLRTRGKRRNTYIRTSYKLWQEGRNRWFEARYGHRYEV